MATYNVTSVLKNFSVSHNSTIYFDEKAYGLHIIDFVIIGVYLIFSIGLGLYLSRRHNTASDFFLAGRSTKWPFIGLSLFASNISSSSLIGLAGDAYSTGISVYNYEWFAATILILFSIVFVPTLLDLELYTLPEFLERRYNSAARSYFSVLTIILNIIGGLAGGLFSGSLVMKVIFPQLQLWHTVAILAVVAGVYTISGGLAAVMYTDALQAVILILGSIMISVYTLIEAGGWQAVKREVPYESLSLVRPYDDEAVPWTGLITGIPLLGFYFWCCNQTIAQRVLSSKDIGHARLGCMLAGFLKLPGLFIMVLPGTMAKVIYPDLPKSDLVYPILLFNLLPVGALGLVLSGFIAALMSQVDSVLNSTSTLVTMDFVKKYKPNLTEKQLMNVGRLVTLLCMIIAVCWAPLLDKFNSIFKYFQILLSYLIPPVVSLYIGGFFWKGANSRGAILALVLGNVWGVAFFVIIEVMGWFHMHFLHVAPLLLLMSFLVLVGVSLTGGENSTEEQLKVSWSYEKFVEDVRSQKDVPLWKNYILHCICLAVVTLIIVGCFW